MNSVSTPDDIVHRDLALRADLDARLADIANRERISVNMVIVQLLQQEMAAASSQEGQKTEG